MIGGDREHVALAPHLVLDGGDHPGQVAVESGQGSGELGRVGAVAVADLVRGLEVHEHEVGHLVVSQGLALDHQAERVGLELREERRPAHLVDRPDRVSHPEAVRALPEPARALALQVLGQPVALRVRLPLTFLGVVAGGDDRTPVQDATTMAGEGDGGPRNAALSDDDGATFRSDVQTSVRVRAIK